MGPVSEKSYLGKNTVFLTWAFPYWEVGGGPAHVGIFPTQYRVFSEDVPKLTALCFENMTEQENFETFGI